MLISWNWLNRHVDLSGLNPAEVAEEFTLKVAELDDCYRVGNDLETVLMVRIDGVEQHPDAKKLSVVTIWDGKQSSVVVCGAPNVRNADGQFAAWVSPGTKLPNGQLIENAELRGVLSAGMLASEQELGLSDDHDGILLIEDGVVPGSSIVDALPVEDWVWEVDNKAITHRADLWGHIGIAREVAMLTKRAFSEPEYDVAFGLSNPVIFESPLPAGCARYLTTRVDNVTIGDSPYWLKRLLSTCGIRPI